MNNRQTKGVSDQVRDEAETERQRERGRLDEVHPLWRVTCFTQKSTDLNVNHI